MSNDPIHVPLDAAGDILLSPTVNTTLYRKLTASEGLPLFLKRTSAANQPHTLEIRLLSKFEAGKETTVASVNLLPVDIAVDEDRDGEITFDGKDKTTAEKPFRFWINNDQDDVEVDEPVLVTKKDCSDYEISTRRDLEDLCRLKLDVGLPIDDLKEGKFKVAIKIVSTNGTPNIRVWKNEDAAGSLTYLTNGDAAAKQLTYQRNYAGGNGYCGVIPTSHWEDNPYSEVNLLFEGVSEGSGQLKLVILKEDSTPLAEVDGPFLNLLDVRKMYRRARIENEPEQIDDPWVNQNPPAQTWKWDDWDWPYVEDPDAEAVTAVLVHGWRLKYMDFMNWSDTSYKRLWHQGFKGKFYSFRWATFSGDNNGLPYGYDENLEPTPFPPGGTTYNPSEYRAWLCGPQLAEFVNQLPNPGRRSLFAHSMGNVIVGAALREGMKVDNYALCNAAMAAMAYDPDLALRNKPGTSTALDHIFPVPVINGDTPDTDSDAAICETFGLEEKFAKYQFPATGNPYASDALPIMTNFGLPDDEALGSWTANNEYFKPDWGLSSGYGYDRTAFLFGHKLYHVSISPVPMMVRQITNPREAMGFVTKSLTRTAGTELRTSGSISGFVDMSSWAPDTGHAGFGTTHSAEWRWNNQSTNLFWKKLVKTLELEQ